MTAARDRLSLTLDCWTDNFRRISYITYTCHWIDEDWTLQQVSLGTSPFPHPHTGDAIADDILKIFQQFEITDKVFRVTTDGGANIIKALKLIGLQRNPCIAHGLHNLINKDFFGNTDENAESCKFLLEKLRKVHRSLLYKFDELCTVSSELTARHNLVETGTYLVLGNNPF